MTTQAAEVIRDSGLAGLPLTGKRVVDLKAAADPARLPRVVGPIDIGVYAAPLDPADYTVRDLLSAVSELFLLRLRDEDDWCGYVERLAPLLPHWSLMPDRGNGRLLAFGHDAGIMALATVGRGEALPLNHAAVTWIDLAASGRTSQPMGNTPTTQLLFADLRQQLAAQNALHLGDRLRALRFVLPLLALACEAAPSDEVDLGTDRYWLHFLEGLACFIETGTVTPENPYVRFVRRLSDRGAYDPGMRYDLADPSRAVARLRPRLAGFFAVLTQGSAPRPLLVYNPVGVTALNSAGYQTTQITCSQHLTATDGRTYRFACMDGNHRVGALWLSGAAVCPIVPLWTNVVGQDPVVDALLGRNAGNAARLRLFEATAQDLRGIPAIQSATSAVRRNAPQYATAAR